ncbi:GIY-YIG nuclease family protein [Mesorhizobium sp. M0145]|uniref:GIY-YIG nuclease family protein n=1 Tax=Mesorhizobium sp. M0145 TaxID=2956895 RepID=UPI003337A1AB
MAIGIYSITNTINGRAYVGKSINVEARWWAHRNSLVKPVFDKKKCNRRLWADVQKFGIDAFAFEILESFETIDAETMADREVFWMDTLGSLRRKTGYNLKRDSSSMTIVSDETRLLHRINGIGLTNPNYGNRWTDEQRDAMRQNRLTRADQYGETYRKKQSENSKRLWQDKEKLHAMAQKVRESLLKYDFVQMDEAFNVIRVWSDMRTLVAETGFAKQCVYAVCDGYKPRYRGFRWKKVLKDEGLLV